MSPFGKTRPFDSWDALKILALFLMFIDHTGYFFFEQDKFFRAIGRGAAPIFLFLAGYASSYRFKKDIFLLAVLMSLSDFLLTGYPRPQNILYNILICRLLFDWLERHGKKIERPYEWVVGCVALFMSIFAVQYGTIGALFAISGYLKRHREYYSSTLPRRFFIFTFVAYGLYSQLSFQFSSLSLLLMILTLCGVYTVLSRFAVHEIKLDIPAWLRAPGKWISLYSGYIYAFHLIALEWLTGVPF